MAADFPKVAKPSHRGAAERLRRHIVPIGLWFAGLGICDEAFDLRQLEAGQTKVKVEVQFSQVGSGSQMFTCNPATRDQAG
jgi:hypothetical protein